MPPIAEHNELQAHQMAREVIRAEPRLESSSSGASIASVFAEQMFLDGRSRAYVAARVEWFARDNVWTVRSSSFLARRAFLHDGGDP